MAGVRQGTCQMPDILPDRLPWYVAGPALGLLVVGLYAVLNRPLGAVGSYIQVLNLARGERPTQPWRVWFFGGIVLGGALAAVLRGDWALSLGYGALSDDFAAPVLLLVLLLGGALMGFGARWAGGCTSGHGLCGVSALSPASVAATGTFMTTAVVATFLIHWLIGGAL